MLHDGVDAIVGQPVVPDGEPLQIGQLWQYLA
jgi:hypothetical protein